MNTDADFDHVYYQHRSEGTVLFNPPKKGSPQDWWAILQVDPGIQRLYAWFLRRYGVSFEQGVRNGAHVSFIKGEVPLKPELWGINPGPVEFFYTGLVRFNDYHVWIDVWSQRLHEIRANLGLSPRTKMSFHMTVGRRE